MADRIEINFTANVREVVIGTEQIGDSLQKTERNLDQVGDQGATSLDKITDATKDTTKASGDLSGSISGDVVGAFKQFDGTAEGALQSASGLISGVSAGFGGLAGAVIGSGVGIAVDLITQQIDDQKKAVEELQTQFSTAYQKAAEAGRTFLTEVEIQGSVYDIWFDPVKREQAQSDAQTLGIDVATVIRAQAGDVEALNTVVATGRNLENDRRDAIAEQGPLVQARVGESDRELSTLKEINGRYDTQRQIQTDNAAAAEAVLSMQGKSTEEIQKANKALAETPKTVPTKIELDETDLNSKLSKTRTIRLSADVYLRDGRRLE